MTTEIRIFGAGCAKCKATLALIDRLLAEAGADARVTKVEDMAEIVARGIMSTPGIEVDGDMKLIGKVPSRAEILDWIGAQAE